MKKLYLATCLPAILLTACGEDVPTVDDPHHVTVGGKSMKQADFLQQHCVGKLANESCDKVKNAMSKDSAKGGLPKGW
jgi:hypothetical protein